MMLAVIALLGMAVVMVHSAGASVGSNATLSLGSMLLSRHAIYAVMAVAAMMLAARVGVDRLEHLRGWRNPLWWLFALAVVLVALAMTPGLGRSVHGARRWLQVGPPAWQGSFQPSELVKWGPVILLAWWCSRRHADASCNDRDRPTGRTEEVSARSSVTAFGSRLNRAMDCPTLVVPLCVIAVASGVVLIEDLGTGVLIAAVSLFMLWAGGIRARHLAGPVLLGGAAIAAAIWTQPYRMARLIAFVDPWADPQGIGYHPIQSMLAIAEGGVGGRGLGGGIQKFGYLPEDTTDFLFAVICEELGLAGALLVAVLLLALLWAALRILRGRSESFPRLLILGVMTTIALQSLLNIAVVTVVVPTKGIALPLLSAGGTGWVVTAFCIGLVASFDQTSDQYDEVEYRPIPEPTPPGFAGKRKIV